MIEPLPELYPDPAIPAEGVLNLFDIPDFEEAAATPRRLTGSRTGHSPVRRASAKDHEKPQDPKVELVLYTSPASEKSMRAIRAIENVLKRYDARQVRFTTCDLSQRPQDGEADSVVFTPTLINKGPGPKTAIIGNLEREEVLCDLLDANGVDRRWDD
jgi:hypothetical protein